MKMKKFVLRAGTRPSPPPQISDLKNPTDSSRIELRTFNLRNICSHRSSFFGNLFLTVSSASVQGLNGHGYSEPELNVFRFAGSLILAPPILLLR